MSRTPVPWVRASSVAGVALAVIAAGGCGRSTPTSTPSSVGVTDATSRPATPSPTSAGLSIAMGSQRDATSFLGDDDAFSTRVRDLLSQIHSVAPASIADMAAVGRDFCAILSGGGAVAHKVDYWAGMHDYAGDDWSAVFLAALRTYCPEFFEGYRHARTEPSPLIPTERADLARFDAQLSVTGDIDGTSALDPMNDGAVEHQAKVVCGQVKKALGGRPTTLSRDPDDVKVDLVLLLTYCPKLSDALTAAVEQAG